MALGYCRKSLFLLCLPSSRCEGNSSPDSPLTNDTSVSQYVRLVSTYPERPLTSPAAHPSRRSPLSSAPEKAEPDPSCTAPVLLFLHSQECVFLPLLRRGSG